MDAPGTVWILLHADKLQEQVLLFIEGIEIHQRLSVQERKHLQISPLSLSKAPFLKQRHTRKEESQQSPSFFTCANKTWICL